ncbi:class I SAM-dependent methyltransferase [Alphaproteobacteria bacterium]|nr:class I SAM-dependent methyltransferase [Alphaproteobacteria bacterium]
MSTNWKNQAQNFFDNRGKTVSGNLSLEALCFVSGRDPRIWTDTKRLEDLTQSILTQTHTDETSTVLEVGCAAGFIAQLLAPHLSKYVGVDIAKGAINAARALDIPNAEFKLSDGESLPLGDVKYDAAICYDVVTNFPEFFIVESIIKNMMRVVRPGGKVMIGSVPNNAVKSEFEKRVSEYTAELAKNVGPAIAFRPKKNKSLFMQLFGKNRPGPVADVGEITCFYFNVSDFEKLAKEQGWKLEICKNQYLNPYGEFRFNAIFTVPDK